MVAGVPQVPSSQGTRREQDTGRDLTEMPLLSQPHRRYNALITIQLYESGPAVKLGTSHLISTQAGLTDPRIVDGIEQRSSLYGLLVEGQGCMGGCAGGPIR